MTNEMRAMDEFDVLLDDVLRTVANPEIPERLHVNVQTRVWVREMAATGSQQPLERCRAVVFSPEVFLARGHSFGDGRTFLPAQQNDWALG